MAQYTVEAGNYTVVFDDAQNPQDALGLTAAGDARETAVELTKEYDRVTVSIVCETAGGIEHHTHTWTAARGWFSHYTH